MATTAKTTLAERLRDMADRLEATIEDKQRPMTENWTHRRQQHYDHRFREGEHLKSAQAGMRALADAHDAGDVPEVLAKVRTKKQITDLMRIKTEMNGHGDYCLEHGQYSMDTPEAKALQSLVKGPSQAELEERKRSQLLEEKLVALRSAKIAGFFPTPDALIERMLDELAISPGDDILEPEAGIGSIVDKVLERIDGRSTITANEYHSGLFEVLDLKYAGDDRVSLVRSDFLEWDLSPGYERIVMNPPFEKRADAKHVRHAMEFLNPGGRLVALMSNGAGWSEFRDENHDGFTVHHEQIDNAFKGAEAFRNTSITVNLVIIDKHEE